MKKDTLVFLPKDCFTIYRITYVRLLLHDNATTLRGLMCLILWIIDCVQEIEVYKIPTRGGDCCVYMKGLLCLYGNICNAAVT